MAFGIVGVELQIFGKGVQSFLMALQIMQGQGANMQCFGALGLILSAKARLDNASSDRCRNRRAQPRYLCASLWSGFSLMAWSTLSSASWCRFSMSRTLPRLECASA